MNHKFDGTRTGVQSHPLELYEERLLVMTERPFRLPLPGGVTRLTGHHLGLMVCGEPDGGEFSEKRFP